MGLRLDYLDRHCADVATPTSWGQEQGEGFYEQATPLPVVGLALHQALGPGWWAEASARAGWLHHMNSHRREGGTVYFSESLLDARAAVGVDLGGGWRASLGVRFLYVAIAEQSREDGNVLRLPALGAVLAVQLRF